MLEIKIKFGHRRFAAAHLQGLLAGWLKGIHKSVPFAFPMVWREPRDNLNDYYFFMTKITGFS
jgi:hypothetical protein